MENKFKEYLINLNSERIKLSKASSEIASPYLSTDGQMFELDKMTPEQRMQLGAINRITKSVEFKIKCIYEAFPQLMESGYTIGLTSINDQEITVLADLMDMKTKKYFLEIAGERVECKGEMTQNEYQLLFNNQMKKMIESGKLTTEMIEDSKDYYSAVYYDNEENMQQGRGR
ncbi:MAG: hypothetical protein IJ509_00655 [Bacilli bacterium]|nr:hypothetical protein [Bacilli bacterium]